MKFEEGDFYDYKIRMCLDNGIRMYLVSDLLRQYNEKHGTNKRFGKYLENKQAQEVIEHLAKTGENSAKNGQSTGGPNSSHLSNEGQNGKFDICDVIQYITFSDFGGANQGYIICEELLHACLMWADPAFACDVYRFLTHLREEDNDYLRKAHEELRRANEELTHENEELTHANKELKNRRVPDEEDQQWYFFITYIVEKDDNVHIYSQHVKKSKWKSTCSRMEREGRVFVYKVKDIPNGFTIKDEVDKILEDLCKKHGGKRVRKNHYAIPMNIWERDKSDITPTICKQAKQARVDLGWRSDLDG